MAEANRYIGSGLYVDFGGTVITGDFRSFEWSDSVEMIDSTAGADTSKGYINGVADGDFKIEYADTGAAGSAINAALAPGNEGTLTWGAQGTVAGKPKGQALAIVKDVQTKVPYDDLVIRTVTLVRDGPFIKNHRTDVWS